MAKGKTTHEHNSGMRQESGSKLLAKIEREPTLHTPRRFYDVEEKISGKSPQAKAEAFLKKAASELQINPDLSQLKFDKVSDSILGQHVLFQQYLDEKPISGAWARIDINKEGDVFSALTSLIPERKLMKAAGKSAVKHIPKEDAIKTAVKATCPGEKHQISAAEEVQYPVDGVPRRAWKVLVNCETPRAEWRVYVDAVNGDVLNMHNQLKAVERTGLVFDPNPVVALNDTSLRARSNISALAYREVVLRDLNGNGHIEGPFVNTKTTAKRVKLKRGALKFKRANRAFKEVMVYFHIDRVQRYIQELGFDNVMNHPIAVNIDGRSDDNSEYSPDTKSLTFGTGGVDDAEDAEIILHEYGHAIQDDQVNGFGATPEGRAMGVRSPWCADLSGIFPAFRDRIRGSA